MIYLLTIPAAFACILAFGPIILLIATLFTGEWPDFKETMKEYLPFSGIALIVFIACLWAAIQFS